MPCRLQSDGRVVRRATIASAVLPQVKSSLARPMRPELRATKASVWCLGPRDWDAMWYAPWRARVIVLSVWKLDPTPSWPSRACCRGRQEMDTVTVEEAQACISRHLILPDMLRRTVTRYQAHSQDRSLVPCTSANVTRYENHAQDRPAGSCTSTLVTIYQDHALDGHSIHVLSELSHQDHVLTTGHLFPANPQLSRHTGTMRRRQVTCFLYFHISHDTPGLCAEDK
jgi:hypothetical protein